MFEKVAEADFIRGEHQVLRFWTEQDIFQKLRRKNAGKPKWSFLDGPITANNPMGVIAARTVSSFHGLPVRACSACGARLGIAATPP
jgi:hypothetical protein